MSFSWANQSVFYHIYPLGLCGAPARNDFTSSPVPRLEKLHGWLDHIEELGANALYLGPLFESTAHGYDTADYFRVDRRLGDRETLAALSRNLHGRGQRLILDGVFNHVGRDFWAFKDLQSRGRASPYAGWFHEIDFSRSSPYGDPFRYNGWSGNYDLVKIDLSHQGVREHLFAAVSRWVEDYAIDGLRLDAADEIEPGFLEALAQHCRGLRSDFWLMGEIVFGDYRLLAAPNRLDSATNYECYKGLFSSHNDRNYFEIAHSLNRQFGPDGIYRDLSLYNFADNHDVDRVASSLKDPDHLYPLYCLLFTIPGIPSIYYGSEWGLAGRRTRSSDAGLRPALELSDARTLPQSKLAEAIARLAGIRRESPALSQGDYHELAVAHEQFAFLRTHPTESVVVAVNAAAEPVALDIRLPAQAGRLVDLLNPGDYFPIHEYQARLDPLPPTWARVLRVER